MARTLAFGLLFVALGACGLTAVGKMTSTEATDGGTGGQPDAEPFDAGADARVEDASTDAKVEPGADAGMALEFVGSGYVDLGKFDVPEDDFTVEAWIRPDEVDSESLIVARDQRNTSESQFRLGLDATGRAFFMMSDDGGDDHGLYEDAGASPGYQLRSFSSVPLGAWSHIAVTRSGSIFALYLNGGQQDALNAGDFEPGDLDVPFRIGARTEPDASKASGFFKGKIDEVRIWSVARSNIGATMRTPIDVADPSFDDLVAYYRFDDGHGVVATDETGSHPGDLIGSPKAPQWTPSDAFAGP